MAHHSINSGNHYGDAMFQDGSSGPTSNDDMNMNTQQDPEIDDVEDDDDDHLDLDEYEIVDDDEDQEEHDLLDEEISEEDDEEHEFCNVNNVAMESSTTVGRMMEEDVDQNVRRAEMVRDQNRRHSNDGDRHLRQSAAEARDHQGVGMSQPQGGDVTGVMGADGVRRSSIPHGGTGGPSAREFYDGRNRDPAYQETNGVGGHMGQEEFPAEEGLEGYKRDELIGQGAYGVVYKATNRATGEPVAIKRIPFSETPEGGVPCSVIREISLLRELSHPNVVQLRDVIHQHTGALYLVFEYVAHDLKTFMDRQQVSDDPNERRGLSKPMVRNFMKQILSGVGECHTFRILHRDLKPHNLLVSADGQLKLADFGLARLSGPNGPYSHEVVTLWYRAPELLLGASRYSAAVDIWSVGCIFAEMATGKPLFPGKADIDQLFNIFQRRGTPTPEMWPAVSRFPYYNREFPRWPEHPITDFVSINALGSQNAADLLNKLLQYDPDHRLVCKTALQHPYFYE